MPIPKPYKVTLDDPVDPRLDPRLMELIVIKSTDIPWVLLAPLLPAVTLSTRLPAIPFAVWQRIVVPDCHIVDSHLLRPNPADVEKEDSPVFAPTRVMLVEPELA